MRLPQPLVQRQARPERRDVRQDRVVRLAQLGRLRHRAMRWLAGVIRSASVSPTDSSAAIVFVPRRRIPVAFGDGVHAGAERRRGPCRIAGSTCSARIRWNGMRKAPVEERIGARASWLPGARSPWEGVDRNRLRVTPPCGPPVIVPSPWGRAILPRMSSRPTPGAPRVSTTSPRPPLVRHVGPSFRADLADDPGRGDVVRRRSTGHSGWLRAARGLHGRRARERDRVATAHRFSSSSGSRRVRPCWDSCPNTVVADLRLIDEFALALIAMLAGGELRMEALRPQARAILVTTLRRDRRRRGRHGRVGHGRAPVRPVPGRASGAGRARDRRPAGDLGPPTPRRI